jgi:4-carboxymuconolactone decarboxylase
MTDDRMPAIPAAQMSEAQQRVAAELVAGPRGAMIGPFIPLLRSPELMSRLQKVGEYLRFQNSLPPALVELIVLMTARQWTQRFEWQAHYPIAMRAGLKPETAAAIAEGRRPEEMNDAEQTVYEFCVELQQSRSVSDPTYRHAVERFGEQGVIDMTVVAGYYSTLAMVMNVARTAVPEQMGLSLSTLPA